MKSYSFTIEDLSKHANAALHQIIYGLIKEGVIEEEDGKKILKNYFVIVSEPGILGKIFEKIRNRTIENTIYFDFVKSTNEED